MRRSPHFMHRLNFRLWVRTCRRQAILPSFLQFIFGFENFVHYTGKQICYIQEEETWTSSLQPQCYR